jgi:hypothetical protein
MHRIGNPEEKRSREIEERPKLIGIEEYLVTADIRAV